MDRKTRLLIEEQIKSDVVDLEIDGSIMSVCPFCNAKHESSFSVTRSEQGILYNCFRAACNAAGFISSLAGHIPPEYTKKKKPFKVKEFTQSLVRVPSDVLEFLDTSYELTEGDVNEQGFKYEPKHNRIYMPVFDRHGEEFGGITKALSKGAYGTKTINYFTRETSRIYYPRTKYGRTEQVAVVEDILSAVKVHRHVDCVAMLGHTINIEQLQELRTQYKDIILMLDGDVIYKALKYKEKYSLYFRSFRVILLEKDPKDMKHEELETFIHGECK